MSTFIISLHLYSPLPHYLLLKKFMCLLKLKLPTCSSLLTDCYSIKFFLCLTFPINNGCAYFYYSGRTLLVSYSPPDILFFLFNFTEDFFKNCLYLLSPLPHIIFTPHFTPVWAKSLLMHSTEVYSKINNDVHVVKKKASFLF